MISELSNLTGKSALAEVDAIHTSEDAQVRVFRHKRSSEFLIAHQCRFKWPFSATDVGELERLSVAEFRKMALAIIVQSLVNFPNLRKTEPAELEKLPEGAQRQFESEHHSARVAVVENGLSLEPFVRGKTKTYATSDSICVKLTFPISSQHFWTSLTQVLDNAD